MAKQSLPGVIALGGERYVPSVLLIHTKHPDGSPALAKFIPDDHEVHLAGGEEFMIVYAPEKMVNPEKSSRN